MNHALRSYFRGITVKFYYIRRNLLGLHYGQKVITLSQVITRMQGNTGCMCWCVGTIDAACV